ncbi:MAG: LrgB family protein [Butyrivibrio sp.]|jgi:predicted murein hydrolase (TIGR00659 family)|nr:LrgB family protein [Butyrivibrio sp.]
MNDFFQNSVFFGVMVSILTYGAGMMLQKKFRLAVFNPLLISIILTILVLVTAHIDYKTYYASAKYLSYLLTPATVCLAIPLYERIEELKKNWKAVLAGISSGVLTSLCSILVMAAFFHLSHKEYVTLLPKSITTAIGMGVSQELGGYVTLTVAVIIITGILGNIFAETICRMFHISEPVAKGVAIGTASHAIGTARAMTMGETEGAMSSLSIAVAGLLTVIGASVFAQFM